MQVLVHYGLRELTLLSSSLPYNTRVEERVRRPGESSLTGDFDHTLGRIRPERVHGATYSAIRLSAVCVLETLPSYRVCSC